MNEDMFNFIRLFYLDAESERVDARLYEYMLVLIPADVEWVQEDLG